MIKFKAFTSMVGQTSIMKQVNEWLEEEQPKTILSSNLYISGSGLAQTHLMTVFYESNPAYNYTKSERRQENV